MGREAVCAATWKRQRSEGKALLETETVVFRGEFRVALPCAAITRIAAKDGRLTLASDEGTLVLDLGDEAERWASKIRNPPTLADKLGVTPHSRVAVVGLDDPVLLDALRARARRGGPCRPRGREGRPRLGDPHRREVRHPEGQALSFRSPKPRAPGRSLL